MTNRREEKPSRFVQYFEWGLAEVAGVRVFPADSHWYLFVQKQNGRTRFGVSGPMNRVIYVPHPANTECFGIRFTLGTFLPCLPTFVNNVLFLPEASHHAFWLNGSAWELPTFDNADSFVARLLREELLIHDPVLDSVLSDQPQDMSFSTIRRRFLRATGLTAGTVRQIERANYAAELLQKGMSILDTVHEAGYFDQPHLTRSLKHFIGQTPAQMLRDSTLNVLYNTPL